MRWSNWDKPDGWKCWTHLKPTPEQSLHHCHIYWVSGTFLYLVHKRLLLSQLRRHICVTLQKISASKACEGLHIRALSEVCQRREQSHSLETKSSRIIIKAPLDGEAEWRRDQKFLAQRLCESGECKPPHQPPSCINKTSETGFISRLYRLYNDALFVSMGNLFFFINKLPSFIWCLNYYRIGPNIRQPWL